MLDIIKSSTGYFQYQKGSDKRFSTTLGRIYDAITIV